MIYCPDYFKRFDSKGFEKQRAVVDKMIEEVSSNAVLVKKFKNGGKLKNGPTIMIYRLKR